MMLIQPIKRIIPMKANIINFTYLNNIFDYFRKFRAGAGDIISLVSRTDLFCNFIYFLAYVTYSMTSRL